MSRVFRDFPPGLDNANRPRLILFTDYVIHDGQTRCEITIITGGGGGGGGGVVVEVTRTSYRKIY